MKMLSTVVFSVAATLGLFAGSALAEDGAYQIELIVFAQSMPTTEVFEQADSQIDWPAGLTELSVYNKPDNTALDQSYAALSENSVYQPVLHVAWVQQLGGAPVHIQSGDGRLNGYLRLQQDQGLQMTVDLEYAANRDITRSALGSAPIYRLNEKRAIKLNEVYYLDHPKFGLVAKISSL